jgi:predicted RNA-binding Zn-ribbon protein involved in translation (DUF1610 family)
MADKAKPKVKVKCQWCGETFIVELAIPVKTKGDLTCSKCGQKAMYSPDDMLEP